MNEGEHNTAKNRVPIAYFLFNRPDKVAISFERIRSYEPEVLYIFADGPRRDVSSDAYSVRQAREAIGDIDWKCDVKFRFRDSNLGLRASLLLGLDEVFANEEFACVVEDDCVLQGDFFSLAEEILPRYRSALDIGLLSATTFTSRPFDNCSIVASSQPSIWGWATWARVWHEFRNSPQVESWSDSEIEYVKSTCCTKKQSKTWARSMKDAHRLNTWDISFGVFLRSHGRLSLYPAVNLCSNVGFGGEATHTSQEPFGLIPPTGRLSPPLKIPDNLIANCNFDVHAERDASRRARQFVAAHPKTALLTLLTFAKAKIRPVGKASQRKSD